MTETIEDERVAYVSPSDGSWWCVAIRDGTGLAKSVFTKRNRTYYDTLEDAHDAAQRRVENDKADRYELSVVAKRHLNND